jgi:hypothetical protein
MFNHGFPAPFLLDARFASSSFMDLSVRRIASQPFYQIHNPHVERVGDDLNRLEKAPNYRRIFDQLETG